MKKQKKRLEGQDSKAGATLAIEASARDATGGHALLREALGIAAAAREAVGMAEAREASSNAAARAASGITAVGHDSLKEGLRISEPPREAPAVVAEVTSLSAFAQRCQQMYQAARTKRADGCIQLDGERLARALADTGIGSRAEQALYSLAILAAADGDLTLFQDDVIAALRKAS